MVLLSGGVESQETPKIPSPHHSTQPLVDDFHSGNCRAREDLRALTALGVG